MYKPTKADLLKLKDSKPISITAHTHECIVPVVYSSIVSNFLKKKGIELPLTHHQLADFKKQAHGYAKGTINLKDANLKNSKVTINIGDKKKKKSRRGKMKESKKSGDKFKQKISQKVYINLGKGRGKRDEDEDDKDDKDYKDYKDDRPNRPSHFRRPDQPLVPNMSNFHMIRPHSYASNTIISTDYNREFQETQKRQSEAIEKYKKEFEKQRDTIKELSERKIQEQIDRRPIDIDMTTVPIRDNKEVVTPDEEKKEADKIEHLVFKKKEDSESEDEPELKMNRSDTESEDEEVVRRRGRPIDEEENKVNGLIDPRNKMYNYEPSERQINSWLDLTRTKTLDQAYLNLLYAKKSHHPNVYDFQKVVNTLPRFNLEFGRDIKTKYEFIQKIIETMQRY